MSGENLQDGFNKDRAELFEALGHPTRIKILQVLSESHLGFSELKKEAGIESNGLLSFHLGKLDGLVKTAPEGSYQLTDEGKEALRIVSVKEPVKTRHSITPLHIVTIVLAIALVITMAFSIYNYQLQTQNFNNLNQSYTSLSNLLSSIQMSESSSTIHPPISKVQALLIALNYGGWNATSLQGMVIDVELFNLTIWHNGGYWGIDTQPVTEPVSNYSAVTVINSSFPSIYTTYSYAWQITIQYSNGYANPPPGYYYVDAATGEVFDIGLIVA